MTAVAAPPRSATGPRLPELRSPIGRALPTSVQLLPLVEYCAVALVPLARIRRYSELSDVATSTLNGASSW